MKRLSITLLIAFLCFNCKKKEESRTLSIAYREFYQNGSPKFLCDTINSKFNGNCIEYYPSGLIKKKGMYLDGKAKGIFEYYDSLGRLTEMRFYKIINNESKLNEYIDFDTNQNILKNRSVYASIAINKDTIGIKDSLKVSVYLEGTYFHDKMNVVIGSFNDEFDILDKKSLDTIMGNKFVSNFFVKPEKVGINSLMGIIQDYSEEMVGTSKTLSIKKIYFKKDYFVKE